jgi:hypothetical protein
MNDKNQNIVSRKPYIPPTFTVLGGATEDSGTAESVIEITFGTATGLSDQPGAQFKTEGGASPDAKVSLPPRPEQ